MKALVTGSKGLIGSHFVIELLSRGYDVTEVDIRDEACPLDALHFFEDSIERFDLIVHAAYLVGGRASIDGLNLNLATNIQLDGAMFNYALRTKSDRVLYFSSSAAYPIMLQGERHRPLLESDIDLRAPVLTGTPDAHYGWAKLTGEKLAVQARSMGLNVHVVRPFSGYSHKQSLDYPFPSIVKRALSGDFMVWGPPDQTRDWIHIEDVINGCMAIIKQNYQEPVNLATGMGTTMVRLLQEAYRLHTGKYLDDREIVCDTTKPTGVLHRVGDITNFFKLYRPRVSLQEGIARALSN